jgi:hypothetical protein
MKSGVKYDVCGRWLMKIYLWFIKIKEKLLILAAAKTK